MNLDLILILIFGSFIGIGIGVLFAKLSEKIKKKRNIHKAKQIIAGKKKNNITMDGETIDVRKFSWKTLGGEIKRMEFNPIIEEKMPQNA